MPALPRTASYRWLIDWPHAGDGAFDGPYDDVTPDTLTDGGGVTIDGQGRDQARATAPPQQSSFQGELLNTHRRYSRENTGSPLTTLIRQGRDTTFRATAGTDWRLDSPDVLLNDPLALLGGTLDRTLFRGTISSIAEDPSVGNQRVSIQAKGRFGRLSGPTAYTQLYTSITTGQAMVYLLTAGGFVQDVDFRVSADALANGRMLAYWYGDGRSAADQAVELWATEGYSAFLGEDEEGVIEFLGRNDRTIEARSQEVQASFYADPGAGDQLYVTGFRIDPDSYEADIINRPTVELVLRAAATLGVIWEYDPVITLDGDGEGYVDATPGAPFTGAVTPVVLTDFTLSSGSVTVALSRTSGVLTRISFSAGTPGATISALQLRGQEYAETSMVTKGSNVDVADSIADYGERARPLDAWPGLEPTDAESLCDAMALAYMDPRPIVEVDVENGDGLHLIQALTRRVGDRIYLEEPHSGVAFDATIEQKAHRILAGNKHVVTWGCEKVVEQDWALYDVDLYGTGIFGQ